MLKAASLRLLGVPSLPADLRARCRRILYRLSEVGDLRHEDRRATLDPLARVYRDVHPLALLILDGSGVAMREGVNPTWTFLWRTPDVIEAGIRNTLSERLEPHCRITKHGLALVGDMKRTLNPDLVFGGTVAVGDIKYKVTLDGSIRDADLNQVTTFATGYGGR